jgi:serine-type D-Ala-D-Ala carboxypeptidase (penicillin-binding protein 5/6)
MRKPLTAAFLVLLAYGGAVPAAAADPTAPVVGGAQMGTTGVVSSRDVVPPPAVGAASYTVSDLRTGQIYAAKDPHFRSLPASTLKTLTALTLLPRLDPKQVITADGADLQMECTCAGAEAGRPYTVDMLFHGLLIWSANDAANLLAMANGGFDKTLADMNAMAAYLHANDTHAATPSGLDGPGQTISAYDLALINREAYKLPAFREIIGTDRWLFHPAVDGGPQNLLSNKVREHAGEAGVAGLIGGKDGWTSAAMHTLVLFAKRDGRTMMVTLVRGDKTFWEQARQLMDWAFTVPTRAEPVGQLVAPGDPPERPTKALLAAVVGHHRHGAMNGGLHSGLDGGLAGTGSAAALIVATMGYLRWRRRRLSSYLPAAAGSPGPPALAGDADGDADGGDEHVSGTA